MTTNPTNPGQPASRRVRASERALQVAFKAMKAEGVPIYKIVVSGGQFEIFCGPHDETIEIEDDGLKDW